MHPETESRLPDERSCEYTTSFNYYIAEIRANVNRTVKSSPFITHFAKCTFHHSSCPTYSVIINMPGNILISATVWSQNTL